MGAWEVIGDNPGYTFRKDKLPYQEYIQSLYQSKMALSPFGQGEVCYRDFEISEFGVVMVKPTMERVNTHPNSYIENETYIPVNLDWSNLNEVVDYALSNFNELNDRINEAIRQKFITEYDYGKLCKYWYDLFSNLNSIKVDEE